MLEDDKQARDSCEEKASGVLPICKLFEVQYLHIRQYILTHVIMAQMLLGIAI